MESIDGKQIKTKDWGEVVVKVGVYATSKRPAIRLVSEIGEPIATLTVNIPEAELKNGEFLIKGWSENQQIARDCIESGLFVDTGKRVPTGLVEAKVWHLAGGHRKE